MSHSNPPTYVDFSSTRAWFYFISRQIICISAFMKDGRGIVDLISSERHHRARGHSWCQIDHDPDQILLLPGSEFKDLALIWSAFTGASKILFPQKQVKFSHNFCMFPWTEKKANFFQVPNISLKIQYQNFPARSFCDFFPLMLL